MAEKLQSDESETEGKNERPVGEAIKELDAKLRPLETQLQAVRDKIREARHEFKAETGIGLGDFDIERKMANIEDDDEREQKRINRQLVFDALSPGQTMDMLEAANEQQAAAD